jgi:hypothetical protein
MLVSVNAPKVLIIKHLLHGAMIAKREPAMRGLAQCRSVL